MKDFLRLTVPVGAEVGLVTYSSQATTLTNNLVSISTNSSSRDTLIDLVSPVAFGGTAIGEGLLAAKDVS